MKKYLLTALMAILVVSLVITGMLPAFANDTVPTASELEVAAINASVDVNNTGANYTGMTVGTKTTGASIGADYVVPNNPGDMTVLHAGTKYTADTLPEGWIGISSAEDWAKICSAEPAEAVQYDRNTYVLLADITVAATVSTTSVAFAGTLYGNGYTITTTAPLFGYVRMAKIYDLTIAGEVTGGAALIVEAFGATIINVKNTANVTNAGQVAAGLLAGQAGAAPLNGQTSFPAGGPLTIDRCVNTGNVTGYTACGIANYHAANNAVITITNTYNTGKIYATAYPSAGISGVLRCDSTNENANGNIVLRNIKNEGEVSSNNTQINAGIVGHITNGVVDQSRTTKAVFENVVNTGKIWDNGKAGCSAGILGQASAGGYTAPAGESLGSETYYGADLRSNVNVVMTNVCNAGAIQGRWAAGFLSRGANTSTTLTNCTNSGAITWSGSNNGAIAGFFSNIAASTWEQTITMKDCVNTANISGYRATGIIALQNIRGTVYMTDVRNEGDISSNYWAGGFCVTLPAAYSKTVLTNCQNDGDIIVEHANANRAGGFYAIQQNGVLVFDKCLNNGTVNASKLALYAGGYIGSLQTKTGSRVDFYNSVNAGTIYGKADSYAGGFYGYSGEHTYAADAPQIFENCENKGVIDARWAAGFAGAIGAAHCVNATNCTNSGEVKSAGAGSGTGGAGGFFANVQQGETICTLNFENCLNSGTISGDRVGGFWAIWVNPTHSGCNNKGKTDVINITNSANTGALNCAGYYAGGAGALTHGEVNVDGWLNTGAITSTYGANTYGYAAGMIGLWNYAFGTVKNAMNTGAITAPMTLGRAVVGNNADGKDSVDVNNNGDAIFGPVAAGLVAEIYGWSSNVTITAINKGEIAGQHAGGILGVATRYTQIQLNECVNFGSVTSTAAGVADDPATEADESKVLQFVGVGGIVGVGNNQYAATGLRLNGCVNAGDVYSENYAAGGLVGVSLANCCNTKIRGCVSMGTVTCVNGVAAGIIAVSENTELTHEVKYPVLDENGEPTYEPKLDENGDAVLDEETGEPVMLPITETKVEVYKGGITVENCLIACQLNGVSAAATFAVNADLQGELIDRNNLFMGMFAEGTTGVYSAIAGENNYAMAAIDGTAVMAPEAIANGEAAAKLGEGWVTMRCCDPSDDVVMPALAATVVFDNIYEANHSYTDATFDEEGHMVACHCGATEGGAGKVAHTAGEWVTADGVHTQKCTGCDYVMATGECSGEAASCGKASVCDTCGAEIAPALEHNYEAVTTDPACGVAGKTVYTCTICGDSYEEEIPALEHNYVDGKCTICGEEDPNYVPPVVEPTVAPGEIVEVGGKLYYQENGKNTYKGLFLYKDGKYYYAKGSGELAVNTQLNCTLSNCDLPTGSYRFGADGSLFTGIVRVAAGLRYYENGKPAGKGLIKVGDDYYYARPGDATLVCGMALIAEITNCDLPAGTSYYFDAEGKAYQGFYDWADGTIRFYVNGKPIAMGMFKHTDGFYYYASDSGKIITSKVVYVKISNCDLPINVNYKFDENGRACEGFYQTDSGLRYYRNGKGAYVGLFMHTDGEIYYAGGNGFVYVNKNYWVTKFDASVQGVQTTTGRYYFGEGGVAIKGVGYDLNGVLTFFTNGMGMNKGLVSDGTNYYITGSAGKILVDQVNKKVSTTNCDLPAGNYNTDANGVVTHIWVNGVATPIAEYLAK